MCTGMRKSCPGEEPITVLKMFLEALFNTSVIMTDKVLSLGTRTDRLAESSKATNK